MIDRARTHRLLALLLFSLAVTVHAESHWTVCLEGGEGDSKPHEILEAASFEFDVLGSIATGSLELTFRTDYAMSLSYAGAMPAGFTATGMAMTLDGQVIDEPDERAERRRKWMGRYIPWGRRSGVPEQRSRGVLAGRGQLMVITLQFQTTLAFVDGRLHLEIPEIRHGTPPRPARRFGPPVEAEYSTVSSAASVTVHHDRSIAVSSESVTAHRSRGRGHTKLVWDVGYPGQHELRTVSVAPHDPLRPSLQTFVSSEVDGRRELLVSMIPGVPEDTALDRQREVIFVMDTSGSMSGDALLQAKKGLTRCLGTLHENDTFNVIEFNSETVPFSHRPVMVRDRLHEAIAWIDALDSRGGTRALPGLELAFDQRTDSDSYRVVILMTDGCFGELDEIRRLLRNKLGDRRFSVLGVGPSINRDNLRQVANEGRGLAMFAQEATELQRAMQQLFGAAAAPVVRDIEVDAGPDSELSFILHAENLPDVYLGLATLIPATLKGEIPAEIIVQGMTRSGWSAWRSNPIVFSSSSGPRWPSFDAPDDDDDSEDNSPQKAPRKRR